MPDTPILDRLRGTIARARQVGKLVIKLSPAEGSALEHEIKRPDVTIPHVEVIRIGNWKEINLDGAAIVWRDA